MSMEMKKFFVQKKNKIDYFMKTIQKEGKRAQIEKLKKDRIFETQIEVK